MKSTYGYSIHTGVDEDGFIHRQTVTPGNTYDSTERPHKNAWHSSLRIGVEHVIGCTKKFKMFVDIDRGNGMTNMIAKNVGALANMNIKTI